MAALHGINVIILDMQQITCKLWGYIKNMQFSYSDSIFANVICFITFPNFNKIYYTCNHTAKAGLIKIICHTHQYRACTVAPCVSHVCIESFPNNGFAIKIQARYGFTY